MPPPLIVRIVILGIVKTILAAVWLFAAAMFVTGAVMWRDWHVLAKQGVDHQAHLTSCVFKNMHTSRKSLTSGSSGYYSCDYQYTLPGSNVSYPGYFQSPRDWKPGEAIAIRYRRDQPSASATLDNLKNPSVTPAALMLLPLLYAGWELRAPLRRALGATFRSGP